MSDDITYVDTDAHTRAYSIGELRTIAHHDHVHLRGSDRCLKDTTGTCETRARQDAHSIDTIAADLATVLDIPVEEAATALADALETITDPETIRASWDDDEAPR